MNILLTEEQFKYIFESQGVKSDMIVVAKEMAQHIIENHLYDLYYDDYEDDENSQNEEEITDTINVDGEYFTYNISNFGDPRKRASTDYESISINYYEIKYIITKTYQQCEKVKDAENIEEIIIKNVFEYLYPLLLHELTHLSTPNSPNSQNSWMTYNMGAFTIEDANEILYEFSENEMNARISSIYAEFENYFMMDGEFADFQNGQEFSDFVDCFIMDSDFLDIHNMETYISLLENDYIPSEKKWLEMAKENGYQRNSLPYCLFRQDRRLKNNRNLETLFNENYKKGCQYVINFYKNQLDNFKKRVRKACWFAYTDLKQKNQH